MGAMKISPRAIGKRIAELRSTLGMTQRQLAAAVGRSAGWVGKVETGDRWPDRSMIEVLARALQVSARDLVFGTDWNARPPRPGAGGLANRNLVRQGFSQASGRWSLPPLRRKGRAAFYVDYSETARRMASELRRHRGLDWRAILRVAVTTPGEAFFVLHVLTLDALVECWSPLEVGLRLMVTGSVTAPIYAGDRRTWCLRLQADDLEVIVFPQLAFLGRSGALYRADFVLGARRRGHIAWLDVEIDEPYHEQQREKDAERDADVPVETLRIPEASLLSPTIFHEVLAHLRKRLAVLEATGSRKTA